MNLMLDQLQRELPDIAPHAVRAYLQARGWEETQPANFEHPETAKRVERPYSVWTLAPQARDADRSELLVPHNPGLSDYGRLLGQLLVQLEGVEGRPWPYVINDIQLSSFDVVRVRLAHADGGGAAVLSLDDASDALVRARDMMLAGACSTVHNKMYFAARKPTKAVDYLRKVRFGQTERGSLVFTLLSPVAPVLRGEGEIERLVGEPFERRVTTTLSSAIVAISEASVQAEIEQRLEPFEQRVDVGVSANLCDALAGLGLGRLQERDVDISFTWAPTREARLPFLRVGLSAQSAKIVREAARELKAKAPREMYRLIGPVVAAKREPTERIGEVKMRAIIDEGSRQVSLKADTVEFDVATQALNERCLMSVVGTLKKDGRSYILEDASDFQIVQDDAELDVDWN